MRRSRSSRKHNLPPWQSVRIELNWNCESLIDLDHSSGKVLRNLFFSRPTLVKSFSYQSFRQNYFFKAKLSGWFLERQPLKYHIFGGLDMSLYWRIIMILRATWVWYFSERTMQTMYLALACLCRLEHSASKIIDTWDHKLFTIYAFLYCYRSSHVLFRLVK